MVKKLLIVNTYGNLWSTGRLAAEIGNVAKTHGWDCYFAYARNSRPCGYDMIKISSSNISVKLHFLLSRCLNLKGFGSVVDTMKFIRKIKRIKPDVIHLHNIHADYLNIPLFFRFLSKSKIPVVWSLHDCWVVTGGCTHFAYYNCMQWKNGCHDCPRYRNKDRGGELRGLFKNMAWMHKVKQRLFLNVTTMMFVPTSQWIYDVLEESSVKDIDKRLITDGVDTDIFHPYSDSQKIRGKYGLGNDFIIMGVGTDWSEKKGLNDYFALSASLPSDCKIVMVGVSADLQRRLPPNIVGISRTDNVQELAKLYSAADVVISLSYQETFGLTVAEGMACGTPSIVYDNTALPELIRPSTGYVVPTGDIERLNECIQLIKIEGKQKYAPKCRESVLQFYNKDIQYERYVKLYDEVVNRKQ